MSSIHAIDRPLLERHLAAPPSIQTPGSSALPPLNELAVEEYSGGDRAVEAEIFRQFIAITAQDIERLHAAVGSADAMAAQLTSHRIKGACRIIGAAKLGTILEHIELASTRADWTAVRSELESMDLERSRLIRYMQERTSCG